MADLMKATLAAVGWKIMDHPPYNPDVTPIVLLLVSLLRCGISPSQGLYLHTEQHRQQ
jgi:hypothetical protein